MIKKFLLISSIAAIATASFIAFSAAANAADGVATGVVVSPIAAVSGPICPVFGHSLSVGATGSDVTELQAYLNAQGYLSVTPTGYFGPLTQSAVARWLRIPFSEGSLSADLLLIHDWLVA